MEILENMTKPLVVACGQDRREVWAAKGLKGTFGGDGIGLHLGYGGGIMPVCIYQKLYAK